MLIKKRNKHDKNFFYLSKKKYERNCEKFISNFRIIKKFKNISVENISNKGLGLAINDRLIRASKK